ncbi:hypothetical protein H8S90_02810 [Olivibacter sp. SDN3]|uniref:hypothetical protein n=1 Tax=Olivibacter sp. SDN3 TaxID=2764720 RepID=UPI001651AA41|nr:hypothetical protein [Olivibacter sp. SDN3]QNL50555.1 hypothetical protein H8S90_02810 [Olivibacter sp. SDN3]
MKIRLPGISLLTKLVLPSLLHVWIRARSATASKAVSATGTEPVGASGAFFGCA